MSTLKVNNIQDTSGGATTIVSATNTAKAWVNFNGSGTVAIRQSYNVTSITDNGTGDYTLNFTNALADGDYSVTTSGALRGNTSSSAGILQIQNIAGGAPTSATLMSTTQLRVAIKSSTGSTNWDAEVLCVTVFR